MKKNSAVLQPPTLPTLRIDKWLWQARFFKSRSQAAKYVLSGKIRVNRHRVLKASTSVKAGDVLTFVLKKRVYVIEICTLGTRRGPAPEARTLYIDLSGDPNTTDDTAPLTKQPASAMGTPHAAHC